MNKITEMLEKCKDKNFLNQNKTFVREYFRQRKSIENLKIELNGKRNYFILNILEKIDFDFQLLIPTFEKKYITQYMYASIFWLYKKSYIDKAELEKIQENFKIMKNYAKMFEDTENHFLMFKVENDRKLQKLLKEEYNNKNITPVKITPNFTGDLLFIINVDTLFDLGNNDCYELEDSKDLISRIKYEFNKYNIQEEGELYSLNRIRSKYKNGAFLFNQIDRILNNRFSRFYNNIVQIKRKGIQIKLVSECSVYQLMAEVTFFRLENIPFQDLYSIKNKQTDYAKIFDENKDKRIVVYNERDKIEYKDKIWYLDIKYISIYNKIVPERQD